MAAIMVKGDVKNVSCYDPSAGSGTLLMNIAHAIGEDNCTIYSQIFLKIIKSFKTKSYFK